MEDKNRNFRSYYYEKVGFRAVEEKKSLEILFKENPIDKKKLSHFTLRFTVPNTYRKMIYSILLDVLPTLRQLWEFVEEQRKEVYDDLVYNLRLLQLYNPLLFTKPQIYVLMRGLENGNLKLNYQQQLKSHDNLIFMRICEALVRIASESDSDLYWISKGFFELFLSFRPYLKTLVAYTDKVMLKEDEKLYKYLVETEIWINLPLETWYENAFLTLLPGMALQRVWDKLLGGSSIYMVFVLLCLLQTIRNSIFQLTTVQKLIECTKQEPVRIEYFVMSTTSFINIPVAPQQNAVSESSGIRFMMYDLSCRSASSCHLKRARGGLCHLGDEEDTNQPNNDESFNGGLHSHCQLKLQLYKSIPVYPFHQNLSTPRRSPVVTALTEQKPTMYETKFSEIEDLTIKSLVNQSASARATSHCPYSSFPVGAALLCKDGTVFKGSNIENISFSLTVCAERTAVVKAVSEGHVDFEMIAVSAVMDQQLTSPCGACRQVLAEFNPKIKIYLYNPTTEIVGITTLEELLPHSFTPASTNSTCKASPFITHAPIVN